MTNFVALLRGVNVTGHNRLRMPELRRLAEDLGHREVRTYIQSGNLVFAAAGPAPTEEDRLERGIRERFGLAVPVVLRTAAEWAAYAGGPPFPDAAERDPSHLLLALSKAPPADGVLTALRARAAAGEQMELVGDALWIHYAGGVARSNLSPAVLDRLVGSPVTARNWRTVQELARLAGVTRTGSGTR